MHPSLLRQLSEVTGAIEPLVGFEIVEEAVDRGCFSVACDAILRMEPGNHWPSAAVAAPFASRRDGPTRARKSLRLVRAS